MQVHLIGQMENFQVQEPSPGYHGLVYHDALGAATFIAKVKIEGLRDLGGALSHLMPFK